MIVNKMLGCLYGQAIGDALGLGAEFLSKEKVKRFYPNGLSKYDEIIINSHTSRWKKGEWTDDTEMMLCILSAYEYGHFDIKKIAENFKDWFNGNPRGIGSHTWKILCMRDYVEKPYECSSGWWELSQRTSAANGGLMRTSVVGLIPEGVEKYAGDICKLTHYDSRCIGSCVIVSEIINNLVWKDRRMSVDEIKEIANKYDARIEEWVDKAHTGNLEDLELDDEYSGGYTLRTLAAGLWAYFHAPDFKSGLIDIINEGGDADTNGAVACAILGAKYGYSSIPVYYIDHLYNRDIFRRKVENFIDLVTAE